MVSICDGCEREFSSLKGLKIHKARCRVFIPRTNGVINDINTCQETNQIETSDLINSKNLALERKSKNLPNIPEVEISRERMGKCSIEILYRAHFKYIR